MSLGHVARLHQSLELETVLPTCNNFCVTQQPVVEPKLLSRTSRYSCTGNENRLINFIYFKKIKVFLKEQDQVWNVTKPPADVVDLPSSR